MSIQPHGAIVELCYVVADMDAAIAHWTGTIGAGPFFVGAMRFAVGHVYRGAPAMLAIRVAFGFSGGVLIELIEPLEGDNSAFTETLRSRGPGYHHMMLREDYDSAFAKLSAQGFAVALESTTPLGERCALFDTQAANGGFIEVMDLHLGFGHLTTSMAAAHADWDGTEPKRALAGLFAELSGLHA
jgi:hypothetical protein